MKYERFYFFSSKIVTSLANIFTRQNALVKIIFWCKFFIYEPIFNFFATLLRTFGKKNDDKILFAKGCFRTR